MDGIADDVQCAACPHPAVDHENTDEGNNSGACMAAEGCDCKGMSVIPKDEDEPVGGTGPAPVPAPGAPVKAPAKKKVAPGKASGAAADYADAADDPNALAAQVDDALDQAANLLANVDRSTLPQEVQDALALVDTAGTASDSLLTAMGVPDDDADDGSDDEDAMSADNVILADAPTASGDKPPTSTPGVPPPAIKADASGQDTVDDTPGPTDPAEPGGPTGNVAFEMPIMVLEGVDTGDGRFIQENALTWRELPLPVMALMKTTYGHDEAELVGMIEAVERIDASTLVNAKTGEPYGEGVQALKATGTFATLDFATEIASLIEGGFLRGVSVDVGDVTSVLTLLDEDGLPTDVEPDEDDMIDILFGGGNMREELTAGRVMGATICPFPAFEGAYIQIVDGPQTPQTREEQDNGVPAMVSSIVNVDTFGQRVCAPCEDGVPIVASAGPLAPPVAWFEDPALDGPTPLTITDDGRVYGHLATWGICHTGVTNRCVMAPKSKTAYGYFRTGAVQCADGSLISTGPITLGGGHAALSMGPVAAVRHYDDSGLAVADVAAGEDRHGIWVAGAMRSDVTPAQVRALRASALSGDWRTVGVGLELVAALAVNAPGFPVVRAQVASGATVSLVAAGARGVIMEHKRRADEDHETLSRMKELLPLFEQFVEEQNAVRAANIRHAFKAGDLRRRVHG